MRERQKKEKEKFEEIQFFTTVYIFKIAWRFLTKN